MKVLALASRFNVSGQGIAAHYLAHELARRGHKVRLRVFDSVPELKGQFKDAAYELDVRPSIAITAPARTGVTAKRGSYLTFPAPTMSEFSYAPRLARDMIGGTRGGLPWARSNRLVPISHGY